MTRSALAFEFPLNTDEDDGFRPDPPMPPTERDIKIDMIIGSFLQAAGEEHTSYALSEALNSIACSAIHRERLEQDRAQRMLGALALAHAGARRALPSSYSRRQIALGLDAAAGLIIYWSESEEQRAARPRNYLFQLGYVARMFRNDMHNLCLVELVQHVDTWVSSRWADILATSDGA